MEHPDFYTVATTIVLVFMIGGIYMISRAHQQDLGGWRLALRYAFNLLPGMYVLNWSLQALAAEGVDNPTLRISIYWAVLLQFASGLSALMIQHLSQHRDTP